MIFQIKDPIYGFIDINPKELKLINHKIFQRLYYIKQLGFVDQLFPRAVHSRYEHSLGTMAMATHIFDFLFKEGDFENKNAYKQMRQTLRLAALLHDLGHAPFSHSLEFRMPSRFELGICKEGKANHEDYTRILIENSDISNRIRHLFEEEGITPELIITLNFKINGITYQPILRQIISSECDADRMDYLQRDSFYCGVKCIKFNIFKLLKSFIAIQNNGAIYLGIKSESVLNLKNFLLFRHYMFSNVYLHHVPVIYEEMLKRLLEDCDNFFKIPTDPNDFILFNDFNLYQKMRFSYNSWARRITQKKPYLLLMDKISEFSLNIISKKMALKKINFIKTKSRNTIFKSFDSFSVPIYIQTGKGLELPLRVYTNLFNNYSTPIQFNRLYISPEDKRRAHRIS